MPEDPVAERPDDGLPARQSASGFPMRRPTGRLVQPGGRHRRAVPASLPEGSPALVLAVPNASDDGLTGTAAEIASILGLDNPALDVRLAKVDNAGRGDPKSIRAVLAEAAARRPAGAPSAVVVPLLATPHPATIREIHEAITASGTSASIAEVFNTNALLAEALHIRLADAGLARADRVRMFSITTSADGIIVATVGGAEAVGSASVTAVLLAARLALPVLPASLDGSPSIEEGATRLQAMGVTRVAIAPCVIGPEANPGAIEGAGATIGAKCAAPLGAHGNVIKLIAQAYGLALSQLETPDIALMTRPQPAGRTAPMRPGSSMGSMRTNAPVYGASTIMPLPM
jgi:sirohydrochlorin ferrochelatase